MKTKIKKIEYWLGVIAIGLMVGLSIQFTTAWVAPPGNPPQGNVGAPINTGPTDQSKAGRLATNGLSATSGYLPGWGGGIHTWDLQADGSIRSSHDLIAGGNLQVNGTYARIGYQSLISGSNGYLHVADTNGSYPGGMGFAAGTMVAAYSLHTPTICLSGDCRSAWPSGGGVETDSTVTKPIYQCPSECGGYLSSSNSCSYVNGCDMWDTATTGCIQPHYSTVSCNYVGKIKP